MKKLLLAFLLLFTMGLVNAQRFNTDSDVISYMDGKKFVDSESGMQIEYRYISEYNTYGIVVTNKLNAVFYFINVSIDNYGNSSDLYGMSVSSGDNFGFRLFERKLIVGYGEPESHTFYLK